MVTYWALSSGKRGDCWAGLGGMGEKGRMGVGGGPGEGPDGREEGGGREGE